MDRLPTGLDYLQGGGSRVSRAWVVPMAQTDPGMAGVLTFFGMKVSIFVSQWWPMSQMSMSLRHRKKNWCGFFWVTGFCSFLFTNFDVMGFHPPGMGTFTPSQVSAATNSLKSLQGFPFYNKPMRRQTQLRVGDVCWPVRPAYWDTLQCRA